jgi:hypothetical protein
VALAEPIPDEETDAEVPEFVGEPAVAKPLPSKEVVRHPFLARQPSMHVDMYNTGVAELPTPLGIDPVVESIRFGESVGMCLNFFYDEEENLFAFCGELGEENSLDFHVAFIDQNTMDKQARYDLLSIDFARLLGGDLPMDLGYMVLDNEGRLVVIDENNTVRFVGPGDGEGGGKFEVRDSWDLSRHLDPAEDKFATVVPDYEGYYWVMALGKRESLQGGKITPARVGVLDAPDGEASIHEFEGEVMENGLAVGPDGVYAVTDHALYALRRDPATSRVEIVWREEYQRATRLKPGVLSYGCGATPTLLGERFVIITDNADEQVNLLVYDRTAERSEERLVCKVPLFAKGRSANENSVIAHGRSILVQNWYDAPETMIGGNRRTMEEGLTRVDIRRDLSGCDTVWENRELATPSTVKMSASRGLVYAQMIDKSIKEVDAWYLVIIDFDTGETVNRILLGTGALKDILFAPTYFGPDGSVYVPVAAGMIRVRDGEAGPAADAGVDGGADAGGDGGAGDEPEADGGDDGGCGCRTVGRSGEWDPAAVACLLLLLFAALRRARPLTAPRR